MAKEQLDLSGTQVLVVDDVSANINILHEALEPEGYEILAAPSGEVALKIAPRAKPDLILLDIMMPGIDGFETCRRLKGDESTADIPIIFITARGETASIVEGLRIGGVDYIIKPFQHSEVRARVRTHLTIKRLQDGLREANARLREANIQIEAQKKAAEQELQDARQVQMALMPDTAPPIEGIEIAGRCVSANTVSGDFFDYLTGKSPNELALIVADVTGKAMKGAMNAVMTDGILRMAAEEMETISPASLMMKVNNVLRGRMERYMNVTMVIGVIHRDRVFHQNSVSEGEITLTLANAGHHAYPLLLRLGLSRNEGAGLSSRRRIETTYRNQGKSQPLKLGGLPLGMRAGIQYTEKQFKLQSGDVVILMTDGIIEAQDSEENQYSDSGRLEQTISQFTLDMSAEAMVEAVLNDAMAFGGDKTQRDDDMTVVVAKIQ
ncbi:SpoIIE family protein phosphatase [bacterium]|nr:SpoIIE family protein phosphatase [bacterium]